MEVVAVCDGGCNVCVTSGWLEPQRYTYYGTTCYGTTYYGCAYYGCTYHVLVLTMYQPYEELRIVAPANLVRGAAWVG